MVVLFTCGNICTGTNITCSLIVQYSGCICTHTHTHLNTSTNTNFRHIVLLLCKWCYIHNYLVWYIITTCLPKSQHCTHNGFGGGNVNLSINTLLPYLNRVVVLQGQEYIIINVHNLYWNMFHVSLYKVGPLLFVCL